MSTYKNNKTKNRTKKAFFACAVLAIYRKDGDVRQRHLNVILEMSSRKIPQTGLRKINDAAMERVQSENGVQLGDMLDIVVLGISFLGEMTPEEFVDEERPNNVQ